MSAVESSEVDNEVLELKEKLSKCERKRDQLLKEEEMMHGRLMRGLDYVEKKTETARQVRMNAKSQFEKEEKALQELLENKKKSVRQLKEDMDKCVFHEPSKRTQFDEAMRKLYQLDHELKIQSEQLTSENDKLRLLQSRMDIKIEKLLDFVKCLLRSSKLTHEVKTLLRSQFTDYVGSLNIEDDDNTKSYAVLTEFIYSYLTLDAELSDHSDEENENDESIANKLWKFLTKKYEAFFNHVNSGTLVL